MKPETLIALRKLAGLTQSGLAASLGVHRVTVARWESGASPIPHWVELAMRAIA
jgi:transcriptional regulator with XRE-family HTH domain